MKGLIETTMLPLKTIERKPTLVCAVRYLPPADINGTLVWYIGTTLPRSTWRNLKPFDSKACSNVWEQPMKKAT